jgi:hypothetical protein
MTLHNVVNKYALTLFFILSYSLMIFPTIIYMLGYLPDLMIVIMIWSPTIAGIIISILIGEWNELKKYLGGFLK